MSEDCACLQAIQCQPINIAPDTATETSTDIAILDPDTTTTNSNPGTPEGITGTPTTLTDPTDSQPTDLTTMASDPSTPDTNPRSSASSMPTDKDTPFPDMLDKYAQSIQAFSALLQSLTQQSLMDNTTTNLYDSRATMPPPPPQYRRTRPPPALRPRNRPHQHPSPVTTDGAYAPIQSSPLLLMPPQDGSNSYKTPLHWTSNPTQVDRTRTSMQAPLTSAAPSVNASQTSLSHLRPHSWTTSVSRTQGRPSEKDSS
jgi:hypothetical protein